MVISGIFLKANGARIVTLTGSKDNHSLIAPKFNKLALPKSPSQDDIEMTKKMVEAGKIMGIEVIDHIIIAKNGVFSFKGKRLI